MKKSIIILIAVVFGFVLSANGQNLRKVNKTLEELKTEVNDLKQRTTDIEEYLRMTEATIPLSLDIFMDENDPTEPGDIKVVKGTLEVIDSCDSLTGWSVESGVGVTIANDPVILMEGVASIKITVPPSTTGVILFTHAATVSLSGKNWLKFNLQRLAFVGHSTSITYHAHFGEDGGAYTDQTMGNFTLASGNVWHEKSWDISAIANADKTTVKWFALNIQNSSATKYAYTLLDYIYGDPGPSSIKSNDGDRIINLYPKIYVGTYTGTNAHQTITIARKGTPAYIRTVCTTAVEVPMTWMKGFGEQAIIEDGAASWSAIGAGVHNVTDCSFDIPANTTYCSTNGETYVYLIMWED